MREDRTASASVEGAEGAGLLERSISYLLGCLRTVAHGDLSLPTPCARWNLGQLLVHLDDSLVALGEAGAGHVDLPPAMRSRDGAGAGQVPAERGGSGDDGPIDLVARLRSRASDTLGGWLGEDGVNAPLVGGCPVSAGLLVAAGALEVAVHGWDLATASGQSRPIPESLAEDLLAVASWAVSPADRPSRFAAPLPVSPLTPAADRLLALLGRRVPSQDPTSVLP